MSWEDILKAKKTISPQGKEMLGGTSNQRKHSLPRFSGERLKHIKTLKLYEDRLTGATFVKLPSGKFHVETFEGKESIFKTKKQMMNYLNALAGNR